MSNTKEYSYAVNSLKHNFAAMADANFPVEYVVLDNYVLKRLIELFGAEKHPDGQAVRRAHSCLTGRVDQAFQEVTLATEFLAYNSDKCLYAIPCKFETQVNAYIDFLIEESMKSGRWDVMLANAAERLELAFAA